MEGLRAGFHVTSSNRYFRVCAAAKSIVAKSIVASRIVASRATRRLCPRLTAYGRHIRADLQHGAKVTPGKGKLAF